MLNDTYSDSVSIKDIENSFDTTTYSRRSQSYSSSSVGKNFSAKEKGTFKLPNRKEEDELVALFQKTGDKKAHERLFEIRKSTIEVWARRYAWVYDSFDDLFGELCIVWLKCVQKYKYDACMRSVRTKEGHLVKDENNCVKKIFKRTPFNTFLFTSFRNHILNTIKKKYSKKRLDESGNPIEFGMRSMDYEFGEDGATLHDVIESKTKVSNDLMVGADWIIEEISQGDERVKDVLQRFVSSGAKDIKSACMLKCGSMKIKRIDRDILISGGRHAHLHLKNLITKSNSYAGDFQINNYQIYVNEVKFEVAVEDEVLRKKVACAIESAKGRLAV